MVLAPGDGDDVAARLAAADGDAAFASAGGLLGPGAGYFAVRAGSLAGIDVTEDWPAVGYEIAAQVGARRTGGDPRR